MLSCFSNRLYAGVGLKISGGEALLLGCIFGCKMLVQYAADGDSASIVEVLLFPESEGDMDSRFCLLIELERLKGR